MLGCSRVVYDYEHELYGGSSTGALLSSLVVLLPSNKPTLCTVLIRCPYGGVAVQVGYGYAIGVVRVWYGCGIVCKRFIGPYCVCVKISIYEV